MTESPWTDNMEAKLDRFTRFCTSKPYQILVSPDVKELLDLEYRDNNDRFFALNEATVYAKTPIVTNETLPAGTLRVIG